MKYSALVLFLFLCSLGAAGQPVAEPGPTALVVIAHPDDEGAFSATLYKITYELKGAVDIFVVTNGEAGYKYSTLAEPLYNLNLTDEKTGRKYLPAIRRRELTSAGKILCIRKIYFMNQRDAYYGQNEREPLDTSWDVKQISSRLDGLLAKNRYDYVFCLPPFAGTHGGHKAATLLALQAAARMPEATRPVVLSGTVVLLSDSATRYRKLGRLKGYAETDQLSDTALFRVYLKAPIGYQGRLNYNIIKAWEIAEHKSQGTMQLYIGRNGDYEVFWYYKQNPAARLAQTEAFFERLHTTGYPSSPPAR